MDEYEEEELFDEEDAALPLVESEETLIIMHRDAHFGGQFDLMLEYYKNEGKGALEELEFHHIEKMMAIEADQGINLASLLISEAEQERIEASKKMYQHLRELYETSEGEIPQLIADLILSEELEPEKEIAALVQEGKKAVPFLLELIRSEPLYDPLFPGYGLAPLHAAECLGLIGTPQSIRPLFELLGHGNFECEEIVLSALRKIGKPAKEFLQRVIASSPVTQDNIRAAMAYISFDNDPEIGKFCLQQLEKEELYGETALMRYLVWGCQEHLTQQAEFKKIVEILLNHPKVAKPLKHEIEYSL